MSRSAAFDESTGVSSCGRAAPQPDEGYSTVTRPPASTAASPRVRLTPRRFIVGDPSNSAAARGHGERKRRSVRKGLSSRLSTGTASGTSRTPTRESRSAARRRTPSRSRKRLSRLQAALALLAALSSSHQAHPWLALVAVSSILHLFIFSFFYSSSSIGSRLRRPILPYFSLSLTLRRAA